MSGTTALGVDLGGALQATTGYADLTGKRKPRLKAADVVPASNEPAIAEERLRDVIDEWKPDLIAVDAPLTLPPCLTCPSSCEGPGADRCELRAAQLVWERGGNPVTERLCEVLLRPELGGGKPLPTMRIGQIAGRGVALARRLRAERAERGARRGPELIEVYPAGTLRRLGLRSPPSSNASKGAKQKFRTQICASLSGKVSGLDGDTNCRSNPHALDALVAAYTGWLGPAKLEGPPDDYNAATGWIWLPASDTG